jgi:hypothetical protein
MSARFKATTDHHYHLSVVGILFDVNHKVIFHYFTRKRWSNGLCWSAYSTLFSETVEDYESLENAAVRGAREEFGVSARVLDFLGSNEITVPFKGAHMTKTMLYFAMEVLAGSPVSAESGAVARVADILTVSECMHAQRLRGVGVGVDGLEGIVRLLNKRAERSSTEIVIAA